MKVLTYVNMVLTVISGDEFFRDTHPKPSFIVGEEFYFEPTLMLTQGRMLEPNEISQAEAFIENFVFPKIEVYNPKEVHAVDRHGNYLGKKFLGENEFEVTSVPNEIRQGITWDFEAKAWYESVLVDERDGRIIGTGLNTSFTNSIYVPVSLLDRELCFESQTYNFISKSMTVDINVVRKRKIAKIGNDFSVLVYDMIGYFGSEEVNSWVVQEAEARAWATDNTVITPFIDALFTSRNFGETKAELIAKIIEKADAYKVNYATLLGKFHVKLKQIEEAETLEVLKAIEW